MLNSLILIPARLASTRLPNKPLLDIDGLPMIIHVWKRAIEADIGEVVVASADEEIAHIIQQYGGRVVLTNPDLPSGSDRIFAALQEIDPEEKYDCVINLQGDLPTLDPMLIHAVLQPLQETDFDITTLAVIIREREEIYNSNVVKAIITPYKTNMNYNRALYFTRASAHFGVGEYYHHIGIYGYRRKALEKFVTLPPSPLEMREKLEQLRALENGMTIGVCLVDTLPLGVDTPADLEKARYIMQHH